MSRTLVIDPVTRIEGHAKVQLDIGDSGQVDAAMLHVLEFRGFERFVQGMQAELMPTITTRICGTCPHAHHLVAAKCLDLLFSAPPPKAALLLRQLLNFGSMLHSHAIHFFALAGPDFFLDKSTPVGKRNLVGLLEVAPDLAKKALRLRSIGQPMTAQEATLIVRQTLTGLGFAHGQQVIHRDIKPSNIMLAAQGVAKLTDFGIARGVDTAKLTRTGMALGTAAYMSPEQIQGMKLDHRTDIYSLGITLYEMLVGRVPFERPKDSDSDFPVLTAHATEAPPPPRQFAPGLPVWLEAAILKALAKNPADRFQTCEEFQTALGPDPDSASNVVVSPIAKAAGPAGPVASPPVTPAHGANSPSPPKAPAARKTEPKPPLVRPVRITPPRRAWPFPAG